MKKGEDRNIFFDPVFKRGIREPPRSCLEILGRCNERWNNEEGLMRWGMNIEYQDTQRNVFWLVLCNKNLQKTFLWVSWYVYYVYYLL